MSEVTPVGAQQQNSTDRSEQAKSSRQERAARTDRQQEAPAHQLLFEQMRRQESFQAAQRGQDNRGQNLLVEQEQGRGQAVDTIA